jgi:hypothetical protein
VKVLLRRRGYTHFLAHDFLELPALANNKESITLRIDVGLHPLFGGTLALAGQVPHFVMRSKPDVRLKCFQNMECSSIVIADPRIGGILCHTVAGSKTSVAARESIRDLNLLTHCALLEFSGAPLACVRCNDGLGGGWMDCTRLASLFWRTANRLDFEAIEVKNERAVERHRVLRSQPRRSSILPAVPQRPGVEGGNA